MSQDFRSGGEARTASPVAGVSGAILVLLALTHLAGALDRALPSVVASLLREDMGLSDQAIGALQGPAFVALYAVSLLGAGHWLRVFDARRFAAGAVVVWTAGGLLFALSETYAGMVCGRALLGAGQAAFVPAALLLIGQETRNAERARGLSLFTAGSAAGRSAALLLGGGILSVLGPQLAAGFESWRVMCVIMIAPNLILSLLLLRGFRSGQVAPRRGTGLPEAIRAVLAAPRRLVSLAFVGAGTVLVVQTAGAWAPTILHRDHALGVPESALVFGGIVLLFAPAGHLLSGWLAGGRRPVDLGWVLVIALLIAAGFAVALALAGGLVAAVIALIGLTLMGGMAVAMSMILFQGQIDTPYRGSVGALFLATTSTIGLGVGPWITGALSDRLGPEHGLAWALAIVVGIAAAGVGVLGVMFGPDWSSALAPRRAPGLASAS